MPRPFTDDAVPSWVHLAIQVWGKQKRKAWLGGHWWTPRDKSPVPGDLAQADGEPRFHVDGFSSRSVLAKIREERDGASSSARGQHYPEGLTGQALEVQRAMIGMPERPHDALYLLYVVDHKMPITRKAEWMDCSVRELYAAASRGRVWIHARLESPAKSLAEFDLTAIIGEILRKDLTAENRQAIQASHSVSAVQTTQPNLRALRRRTLTLKQAVAP